MSHKKTTAIVVMALTLIWFGKDKVRFQSDKSMDGAVESSSSDQLNPDGSLALGNSKAKLKSLKSLEGGKTEAADSDSFQHDSLSLDMEDSGVGLTGKVKKPVNHQETEAKLNPVKKDSTAFFSSDSIPLAITAARRNVASNPVVSAAPEVPEEKVEERSSLSAVRTMKTTKSTEKQAPEAATPSAKDTDKTAVAQVAGQPNVKVPVSAAVNGKMVLEGVKGKEAPAPVGAAGSNTSPENGQVAGKGKGGKTEENVDANGKQTGSGGSANIAAKEARGGVFGPLGQEGDSKPTNQPGFTKLWQPQPHNVTPGRGKQVQVYQTMAAGKTWDSTTAAMEMQTGAQVGYVNWLVNQPHRFGVIPTDPQGNPTGARQEVATLAPYPQGAYDAGQAPDEASWSMPGKEGYYLVQCSIHPEVGLKTKLTARSQEFRDPNSTIPAGEAHQDAKNEIKRLSPFWALAGAFDQLPKWLSVKR